MAKYHGNIGFSIQVETAPGIWENQIIERMYTGDLISINRRTDDSSHLNDDMVLNHKVSIIADAFINDNLMAIRYISFSGSLWKIKLVEVQRPRLILTVGGIYNGQ